MTSRVPISPEAVSAFCQRHHIRRLALFGSVLRDDFRPDSDVDVLVEFELGHVPGLRFVSIEQELSQLLGGRRVDMVTPKILNPRIRGFILRVLNSPRLKIEKLPSPTDRLMWRSLWIFSEGLMEPGQPSELRAPSRKTVLAAPRFLLPRAPDPHEILTLR